MNCTFVIRTPFSPPKNKKPNVWRGVYHVHSEFSHDSKASLDYIVKTAKKAGLDFVVVTDHNNIDGKKAYQPSSTSDPLLIFGTEISTWHDGHLGVIGSPEPPFDVEQTQKIIDIVHRQGGYAIPAHPYSKRKPWTNWEPNDFNGMEIFCFSDFFYEHPAASLIWKAVLLPSRSFLKSVLVVNPKNLERWDQELATGKRMAGFGAVDAHIKFRFKNFIPENYLMAFQSVTMYVSAEDKTEAKIVEALAIGKSFMAFEVFGLADEFSFSAFKENKSYGPGETLTLESPVQLTVKSPKPAHIKLIHNGTVVNENEADALIFKVTEKGYYRVEIYLDGRLWIISNPIYVAPRN